MAIRKPVVLLTGDVGVLPGSDQISFADISTPGSDTRVLYNAAGGWGAASNFTFVEGSTPVLTVGSIFLQTSSATASSVGRNTNFWEFSTTGSGSGTQFSTMLKQGGYLSGPLNTLEGWRQGGATEVRIHADKLDLLTHDIVNVDDIEATTVRAVQLISTQTTGTAPLTVASTTLVTNLNADLLDGQHGAYYLDRANHTGTLTLTTLPLGFGTATTTYLTGGDLFYEKTGTVTTTSTSITTLDQYVAATYISAKYTVQVENTVSGAVQFVELLLTRDSSNNTFITEYGDLISASALATFTADYDGSTNVRLRITPASTDSMRFTFVGKVFNNLA